METKALSPRRFAALTNILANKPALLWLLVALAVRLLAGTALHLYSRAGGLEGFYPLASGGDDRVFWDQAQSLLAGVTPERIFCPYPYVLAALFSLVGPSLVAGKLLNIVVGSLTVSMGVLIARELTAGRPYNWRDLRHPVNLTGLLLTLYPSAVFHSTQLLRDSLLVFFGIVSIYFALRIIRGDRGVRSWFGYALALFLFYAFRPYAAFALAAGFTLYLLYYRHTIASVLVSLFGALAAPWLAGWGPFAWRYVVSAVTPAAVESFREEVYAIGGSAIGVTVDFTSIHGFLWTYAYSFLTAMFGPFVWQVRSPVVAIGLVESVPLLLLAPVWGKGIWRLLRRRSGEAGFLLFFSLLLIGAIALFSANIGANVRLRLLPWIVFLIYAAVSREDKPACQ
ncbi:MAG: hypothetical protein DDT21_02330 [Syntrophomonadaceae bacterium]|nr:hypothetical protein [Bacillota bacterium]